MNIHDYIRARYDGTWVVEFLKRSGQKLIILHESTHRTGWNAVVALTSYCLKNGITMDNYDELQWRRYYSDCDFHVERMMDRRGKVSESEWQMAFSCDAPNKPGYSIANND